MTLTALNNRARTNARYLGVDMGLASLGAAIIHTSPTGATATIKTLEITTPKDMVLMDRMNAVIHTITTFTADNSPVIACCLEVVAHRGFVGQQQITMLTGALAVALNDMDIRIMCARANQIKKYFTNQGRATKEELDATIRQGYAITYENNVGWHERDAVAAAMFCYEHFENEPTQQADKLWIC